MLLIYPQWKYPLTSGLRGLRSGLRRLGFRSAAVFAALYAFSADLHHTSLALANADANAQQCS